MIANRDPMSVNISDVYNEIVQLSRSVGECHASIGHVEDSMIRIHGDLKESINRIDGRLSRLEVSEIARERRYKFIWNLINISPVNIAKWASVLILTGSIIATVIRMNLGQTITRLFQFAMG